jgi:hydrogenase maturation factor
MNNLLSLKGRQYMKQASFTLGKLPPELLKEKVLSFLGSHSPNVLVGAKIGEDAAILELSNGMIALAADPITGSIQDIGRLAINVNANDIATVGAVPRWFLSTILLPSSSTIKDLEQITKQLDAEAKSLEVAIIGGHTEITNAVNQVVISGAMIGEILPGVKPISTSGAKSNDDIVLTKTIGLEGTAILMRERSDLRELFSKTEVDSGLSMFNAISVVPEALLAAKKHPVTAMHDPTEGGLAGGLYELADASQKGFIVYEDQIPISSITKDLCTYLAINPLNLISSGTLLITISQDESLALIETLKERDIAAKVIGKILSDGNKTEIRRLDKNQQTLPKPRNDALWKGLENPLHK